MSDEKVYAQLSQVRSNKRGCVINKKIIIQNFSIYMYKNLHRKLFLMLMSYNGMKFEIRNKFHRLHGKDLGTNSLQ